MHITPRYYIPSLTNWTVQKRPLGLWIR